MRRLRLTLTSSSIATECHASGRSAGTLNSLGRFAKRLVGHQQVTDAYLLALQRRRCGVLAGFDAGRAELGEAVREAVSWT